MRVYPERAVIDEVFTEVLWVTGNRYEGLPYADMEFECEDDGYPCAIYIDESENFTPCCGLMGPCAHDQRECVPFTDLPGAVQRDILRTDVNWWDHDQRQGFTVAQRDQVIENVITGKMPDRWLEGVATQEASTDKRLTAPARSAEVLKLQDRLPAQPHEHDIEMEM